MSRTPKRMKPPGYEFWGSRGGKRHGETPGSYTKKKTHKRERRVAKNALNKESGQ